MNMANAPLSGHPDRLCDLIAAGVADEYLKRDPESRVRLSVTGGHGALFLSGEVLTSADFDVTHLVQRLLGSHGLHEGIEPFVSIEQADSSRVGVLREACPRPIMGFGYATQETDSYLPRVAHVAKAVAKKLNDKRLEDPDWFWLGPAGEVCVDDRDGRLAVHVEFEQGVYPLDKARIAVCDLLGTLSASSQAKIEANPLGPLSQAGLKAAIGRSGTCLEPYGRAMPSVFNPAGTDWHDGRFLADAMARLTAGRLVKDFHVRAAFVRLRYDTGERRPTGIWARDERGRDLAKEAGAMILDLDRAKEAWRRPGLMTDMTKHGMVGDGCLPWENA